MRPEREQAALAAAQAMPGIFRLDSRVCGVSVQEDSSGEFQIAVLLDAPHGSALPGLPSEIEGVPVVLLYTGGMEWEGNGWTD